MVKSWRNAALAVNMALLGKYSVSWYLGQSSNVIAMIMMRMRLVGYCGILIMMRYADDSEKEV